MTGTLLVLFYLGWIAALTTERLADHVMSARLTHAHEQNLFLAGQLHYLGFQFDSLAAVTRSLTEQWAILECKVGGAP